MSLGAVAASRIDLNKIGTPYLKKLMQTVEETCFIGVLSGDEIVYIAKENCERTITTNAGIGIQKTCILYRTWKSISCVSSRKKKALRLLTALN